jgi:hypothetical protein
MGDYCTKVIAAAFNFQHTQIAVMAPSIDYIDSNLLTKVIFADFIYLNHHSLLEAFKPTVM